MQEVMSLSVFGSPGQGWIQLSELAIAFILSALIGLERDYRRCEHE